jgi:hypothetical protein
VSVQHKIKSQGIKDEVYFLRLKLLDKENKLKDQNFYWLSQPGKSYEKLNDLKQTTVQAEFKTNTKGEKVAVISNPGSETAFFIRLKIADEKSGELALPVFFSDNYFTLMPGESREINVDITQLPENEKSKSLNLEMEGWNIKINKIKL